MRSFFIFALFISSLSLWAQDNTWERPDEEQETGKTTAQKVNPDQKYLRGAVPEVNGHVVFQKTIDAPGKSALQVYDIALSYMQKMAKEKNQINNTVLPDSAKNEVSGVYEEWLVFKSNALFLDRTRLIYTLHVACHDGKADITINRIRYIYEENRDLQRYTAEKWISDQVAVNKKNTKLIPLSAKFRRKTVDRMQFLFNKFDSLLK